MRLLIKFQYKCQHFPSRDIRRNFLAIVAVYIVLKRFSKGCVKTMDIIKTNGDLFNLLRENLLPVNEYLILTEKVLDLLCIRCNEGTKEALQNCIQQFCKNLSTRWRISKSSEKTFKSKYQDWLARDFNFPSEVINEVYSVEALDEEAAQGLKPFNECCDRQKRRRTEDIRQRTLDEVIYSLKTMYKHYRQANASKIINFLHQFPEEASKIWEFCQAEKTASSLTKEIALCLIVSLNLSVNKYNMLRKISNQYGIQAYPSYYQVKQAKLACYPDNNSITITDVRVAIKLQALLDHTALRILMVTNNVTSNHNDLILYSKWGCDGASDQSQYKQPFENEWKDATSIIIATLVPLKLVVSTTKEVLWENLRPSSTWYCRPIMFNFTKETEENLCNEITAIKNEVEVLSVSNIDGKSVKHEVLFTMIDGKVCNVLSGNRSSSTCYICGATPTQMNDLTRVISRVPQPEFYEFGLSLLHCWIKCFECLLHIGYKLPIQKWSTRNTEEKHLVTERKKIIQDDFKTKLGLLVDIVKQGAGNTNDGNTARRFFKNWALSATITGVDENLIKRFYIILQALSSGFEINAENLAEYNKRTAELYVQNYGWYYMPVTVHKLLIHAAEIVRHHAIIPIGKLSEEAQEARNKEFRNVREWHTRKCSRTKNNEDIINNLLIYSDPYISSLRIEHQKKKEELLPEAVDLLILADGYSEDVESSVC